MGTSETVVDTGQVQLFHAVAFVENLSLRDLAAVYPEARRTPHELSYRAKADRPVEDANDAKCGLACLTFAVGADAEQPVGQERVKPGPTLERQNL